MSCELLRIEPAGADGARRRFVCACGKIGYPSSSSWQGDADRRARVSWECHRAAKDSWRKPRGGAHRYIRRRPELPRSTQCLPVYLLPDLFDRISSAARATGRTLQEYARDVLLASVNSSSVPANITPGVTVEWEPEHASGSMRARVTRVADGRVFVEIRPASRRKPATETWFEPDEVHRLRVVAP